MLVQFTCVHNNINIDDHFKSQLGMSALHVKTTETSLGYIFQVETITGVLASHYFFCLVTMMSIHRAVVEHAVHLCCL